MGWLMRTLDGQEMRVDHYQIVSAETGEVLYETRPRKVCVNTLDLAKNRELAPKRRGRGYTKAAHKKRRG